MPTRSEQLELQTALVGTAPCPVQEPCPPTWPQESETRLQWEPISRKGALEPEGLRSSLMPRTLQGKPADQGLQHQVLTSSRSTQLSSLLHLAPPKSQWLTAESVSFRSLSLCPGNWELSILRLLNLVESKWEGVPLFRRLQENLAWWEENSPPFVTQLITGGVQADFALPEKLSLRHQVKSSQEIDLATSILEDYQKSGATVVVQDQTTTRHLVPWFVLSKPEGGEQNIGSFRIAEN